MSIFKAYDVRGLYPSEINEKYIRKVGRAFASFIKGGKIGVGRDMRLSSPPLAAEFAEGLREGGADTVDLGMISTPMLYFAVGKLGLAGGANVTASHNPPEYNGLKLCRENAIPIGSDSGLGEIEKLADSSPKPASKKGKASKADIAEEYEKHIRKFISESKPIKVVIDAGNGMVGPSLGRILPGLKSKFVTMYMDPDGNFPHHEANPIKIENLKDLIARVKAEKADMGAAFDGDADRCVFVDEKGAMIPGDLATAVLAREIFRKSGPGPVVYDLRSSMVVEEEIKALGGTPVREKVGHSFIKATMRRENAVFGGELSGHYYFKENYTSDNAEIAFFSLFSIVSSSDKPLSAIVAPVNRYFASGEINFKVQDKDGMINRLASEFSNGKQDTLDGITVKFDTWWFNVRKSNTEPMLRLNLEGRTKADMDKGLKMVKKILENP